MKIIVIGENAKEQALGSLLECRGSNEVLVVPGNPGTVQFEQSVEELPDNYNPEDIFGTLVEFEPDLVILCDEDLIRKGWGDSLSSRGWNVLAPDIKACHMIDDKPLWAKIMQENDIPVADFRMLNTIEEARKFVEEFPCPFVLKEVEGEKRFAIPYNEDEALDLLEEWFGNGRTRVMVSEFKEGRRFNLPVMVYKARVVPLLPYIVMRGIYEHEDDPQAKGMGAVCSARGPISHEHAQEAVERIMVPFFKVIQKRGVDYNGLLTGEFVLTDHGLVCVNMKPGLSETGAVSYLQLLRSDLAKAWFDLQEGKPVNLEWRPKVAVSVVLAGKDYPQTDSHDAPIVMDEDFEGIINYNHAKVGENGRILTDGGRVLILTRVDETLAGACAKVQESADAIHCSDLIHRSDIGQGLD